jgi:transaldolase
MKFFVDTADTADIAELNDLGLLDGVTTNPSLIAKSGRDFKEVIAEICGLVEGPVSAEVTALDADGMIKEGKELAKIAKNVTVKVPLTLDGLKACKALSSEGTMVNVTLCFSANQALLAAKCGATFISPFIGRLDDINIDGMELIADIRAIYDNYPALGDGDSGCVDPHCQPCETGGDHRRRCCNHSAECFEGPGQTSADRQGHRCVHGRLGENRSEHSLGRADKRRPGAGRFTPR